ncbi:uncharacterized protein LOC108276528 [Ictalurus punctatus]|uniref:Uncharacterized protein LOC108276528 n=1 Tax=Ictalurus punctatus TaxID=7998 RepID=A0A2D0SM31_ICTPU|nr:uncharacterized protein LOC108276528 [Ictalurus punctatus]
MLWAMKRLHLIFIALVLWRDTNGFGVWNRTSVVDLQAGHFNATWNQNFHLATPVQSLELLSRKGANGDEGGRNSSSFSYTLAVQTAPQDSSFVQSSGGAAQGKPVLNAQGQAAPMVQPQDNLTSQSSRLDWFEFLKPKCCGSWVSQSWPQKGRNNPGFQRPSSFQLEGAINQPSGFQTQSSYQPSTTTQVLAGQSGSSSQAQGSYGAGPSAQAKWYSIVPGQTTPSFSQVPGIQTQSSYQPSTTTQVLAGQFASSSQVQGSYGAGPSAQAKWYSIVQGQTTPSFSQVPGIQTQSSYQPSTTTQVLAGQFASSSQVQGSYGAGPSAQAKWYSIVQGQTTPSFSQASGIQTQSSYQPSTTTRVQTGQSASTAQAQGSYGAGPSAQAKWYSIVQGQTTPSFPQVLGFQTQSYQPSSAPHAGQFASTSQAQNSYVVGPSGQSKWYSILQDQTIPSSSEIQTKSSYQPITTTQVQTSQSAFTSQAQSSGASPLHQGITSGRYLTSHYLRIPYTSQSGPPLNQISGFHTQSSYQPITTTQVQTGQPASTSQAQDSYGTRPSGQAKWYSILQDQNIPSSSQVSGIQTQSSYQPSYTTQSPSTSPAHSMAASTFYQGQVSSMYNISQDQSITSSVQSVFPTNKLSGTQTQLPYQPSITTQVSTGQPDSTSQAQDSYGAGPSGQAKWYSILQDQTIPTSSQAAGLQTQSSYQPSTPSRAFAGQSIIAQTSAYPSQTSGKYTISQGLKNPSSSLMPGFQTQSLYHPSTTEWVSTGQSAYTSQAQGSYEAGPSGPAEWLSI